MESPEMASNVWKRKGGKLRRSIFQYSSVLSYKRQTVVDHLCWSMVDEAKERKAETVSLAKEVEA